MNGFSNNKQTLVDIVRCQAAESPTKIAFEFLVNGEDQKIEMSYAELDHHARAIGAALQSLHMFKKRVLLLFPPGLDFISAFIGCQYAGAVAVPTYPPDISRLERSLPRFMAIVNSAGPGAVLTTSPILAMSQFFIEQFPDLEQLKWLAVDSLYLETSLAENWTQPMIQADSLACLQYTSGSTAEPKGVMLTQHNLFHQLEVIKHAFGLDSEGDRPVFWLPFYHDMGLIGGILGNIYYGGTNTLMSPLDFLQRPIRWLQAISRSQATISGGPNFAYEMCIRKVTEVQKEALNLSSWTLAFNGAEPIRMETLERFAKAFEPCGFRLERFYPCYGLAEATLLVTGGNRGELPVTLIVDPASFSKGKIELVDTLEEGQNKLVGCGHPWGNQRVMIVDHETATALPQKENSATDVGEIWVSGESVAQGYWERPDESQKTFQARLAGFDQNFLRTGDLGFLYRGELFVTGRIKDLIIIDGLNHYPQDIELTVEHCHPALRPGCSAAFSTELEGQEQLVIVTEVARPGQLKDLALQNGHDVSPAFIIQTIRSAVSLEHDLRVSQVLLLKSGSVPKTSSGKIQRHACKLGFLNNTLETWDS